MSSSTTNSPIKLLLYNAPTARQPSSRYQKKNEAAYSANVLFGPRITGAERRRSIHTARRFLAGRFGVDGCRHVVVRAPDGFGRRRSPRGKPKPRIPGRLRSVPVLCESKSRKRQETKKRGKQQGKQKLGGGIRLCATLQLSMFRVIFCGTFCNILQSTINNYTTFLPGKRGKRLGS